MQKQKIALISGLVLAFVSAFLVKVYMDQKDLESQERTKKEIANIQAGQAAVLVANRDIPKGTIINADMLKDTVVPNKYVQPKAVGSLDRIAGMTVVADISKGEQVTLNKLAFKQDTAQRGGSLAMVTPIGKRAITVNVDNMASLVGMVRAGDYVDVIAMVPVPVQTASGQQVTQAAVIPLFQNVLVLAVGQELSVSVAEGERGKKAERKETSSSLVTIALTPEEANLIAFVQEQGKIRFMMRSPADSKVQPLAPASWDTLFRYITPPAPPPRPGEEPVEPDYVEIYRGMNKERIPLQ